MPGGLSNLVSSHPPQSLLPPLTPVQNCHLFCALLCLFAAKNSPFPPFHWILTWLRFFPQLRLLASKRGWGAWLLKFDDWSFSGAWMLELEAFPPSPLTSQSAAHAICGRAPRANHPPPPVPTCPPRKIPGWSAACCPRICEWNPQSARPSPPRRAG